MSRSKKTITLCALTLIGSAFYLQANEALINKAYNEAVKHPNYQIDWKFFGQDRDSLDKTYHKLDQEIGKIMTSLYQARSFFTKKRNDSETKAYNELTTLYNTYKSIQDKLSESWSVSFSQH